MNILEQVEKIKNELNEDVKVIDNLNDLSNLKVKYLGKKGLVTMLTKDMASLSIEEKKEVGRVSNEVKKEVTSIIEELENKLNNAELEKRLASEKIDITLPSVKVSVGGENILEKLIEEVE